MTPTLLPKCLVWPSARRRGYCPVRSTDWLLACRRLSGLRLARGRGGRSSLFARALRRLMARRRRWWRRRARPQLLAHFRLNLLSRLLLRASAHRNYSHKQRHKQYAYCDNSPHRCHPLVILKPAALTPLIPASIIARSTPSANLLLLTAALALVERRRRALHQRAPSQPCSDPQ